MESDLQQPQPIFQEHQHQQPMNSGLTRYRSAPSSYFTNIIDKDFYEHIFNKPSSPETERVFSRLLDSFNGGGGGAEDSLAQNIPPVQQNSAVKEEIEQSQPTQVMPSMKNETMVLQQQQGNMNNYSPAPQSFYQSSAKPPLPNQSITSGMEGAYSVGVNRLPQMKTGSGNSNLVRHSSSPAGLFSNINIEGFTTMRGMGTFGAGNSTNEEANFPSASKLKNQPSYSSALMSSISEIGDKGMRENNPESEAFGEEFITNFPVGPWDDSAMVSDNIGGLKRYRDDDAKTYSGLNVAEAQNETGSQAAAAPAPAPLAHHLSLPKTAAEMAAIEKFLQFSDSVPCKIRAKRGCATHPRSIAERVRRTKISERMRKLQDLVPNMDKQTNTADMLDLAVDYIKDLQEQVQTLSDCHSKCTCSHKPQL